MAIRQFSRTILPSKLMMELSMAIPLIFERVAYSVSNSVPLVTVHLSQEPNAAQDQAITDTVNNHVPSHLSYKIWDYVIDPPVGWTSPVDLDYKKGLTIRLHPKKTFIRGELILREYFKDASVNPDGSITFSNPVLKEEYVYTRDGTDLAISRIETISWYREDDSLGLDVKINRKFYDGLDKIQEGSTRRANVFDGVMIPIVTMLGYAQTVVRIIATSNPSYQLTDAELEAEIQKGKDFITFYDDSFNGFVKSSDRKIVTDITNDTAHPFLDIENFMNPGTTIRDFLIGEFNLGE